MGPWSGNRFTEQRRRGFPFPPFARDRGSLSVSLTHPGFRRLPALHSPCAVCARPADRIVSACSPSSDSELQGRCFTKEKRVTSERTGNSPRGKRGGRAQTGRPPAPGQGGGQRRPRPANNRPGRGAPQGGGNRSGGAARPPRSGGQGGYQRRTSSTSGWTTVRPWRPPRDDADEAILEDDDTQPNWDALPAQRPQRQAAEAGRPRSRPPAWPGNAPQGGRRNPGAPGPSPARRPDLPQQRTQGGSPNARRNQRPSGSKRRSGTWIPPESAPKDED